MSRSQRSGGPRATPLGADGEQLPAVRDGHDAWYLRIGADRARAAGCAKVATWTGTAGLVTLGVMFAVEVPRGGPFVFGTTNDALGVVTNVLFLPVFAALGSELPAGPARDVLLPVTLGATVAAAASGALLVARLLPFAPSTAVSVASIEVQAVWMLLTHQRLLRLPDFPPQLGRLGRAIGAAMLCGSVVAALSQALPRESRLRRATLVAGAVPGIASWLAWPAWLHLASRYLQRPPARSR